MSITLYPITGGLGLIVTLWLLSLGLIATKRKQWQAVWGFLLTAPAAGISTWAITQADPSWHPEPQLLAVKTHYSVLGTVLVILTLLVIYYMTARRDEALAYSSGTAWMLPATCAAWCAVTAMLLDIVKYHKQWMAAGGLLVLFGFLACALLVRTALAGLQAWGDYRHRNATE